MILDQPKERIQNGRPENQKYPSTFFTASGEWRIDSCAPGSDLKKILSNSIQEVNALQTQANEAVQGMVLGKTDIHTAMIAMEKSGISFRLMMAVRNRMISAYEEVMRMQI